LLETKKLPLLSAFEPSSLTSEASSMPSISTSYIFFRLGFQN
jgi:hypothetical protein